MFSLSQHVGRLVLAAPVAVAVLGASGQAMAADRGGHGHGHGGWDRGPRIGFGIGFSDYGSSFSIGVGRGYYPPVRSYCPPVYVRPYCPPVYYSRFDDCYPRREVIVTSSPVYLPPPPVVVERRVIVQTPAPQPVYQQPVYQQPTYQQPVVQQAAVQQPVINQPVQLEARPAAPVVEQATYRDRELGDAYMKLGDPENAARVYSKYLTAWNGDGTATRNLGLAQIARGDAAEGAKSVVRGYQLEPAMTQRGLSKAELGGEAAFQKTLDNATRAAAGNNTAESWLTVAILQQAAGQKEQAVGALQKSRDAGLEKGLLDQFTLEMTK